VISRRFTGPVTLLLGLALVPTITHSYIGARADDGRVTGAIRPTLGGFVSEPTDRRAAWVAKNFDSDDWIERRYTGTDGSSVLLFVARSFDLKRLYHHPELAVLYGHDFDDGGVVGLPDMPAVLVRQLNRRAAGGGTPAAYALFYDGSFVENPITLQLRTSLALVVGPRKPITLFMVLDEKAPPGAPFATSPAAKVLAEAITSFLDQ